MPATGISIKVNGTVETVEFKELDVTDAAEERQTVVSKMCYWGSVWSEAKAQSEKLDARYRAWRGVSTQNLLAADPKMAEWRLRAQIDGSPEFIKFKDAQAEALEVESKAYTLWRSYEQKAVMLGQLISREVSEIRSAMHVTRTGHDEPDVESDPRTSKIKDALKATKAKRETEGD